MNSYTIGTFIARGEIRIDYNLQNQRYHPFTMEKAQIFFGRPGVADLSFEIDAVVESVRVCSGTENYPGHSDVTCLLYDKTIDDLENIHKPIAVGLIEIEYSKDVLPRIRKVYKC